MKEFQSKITYDNLTAEVEVCKHLLKKGFRTSEFLKNVHGDYSLLQMIFAEEEPEASGISVGNEPGSRACSVVIDFSSVCCLPPTWEIIRSYSYAVSECRDGNHINYGKFKKYLDEYLLENNIPAKDIVLMPSLYFFSLLRSTYGYKQLLKENSKQNIEFAFWRTRLCKWLYTHLEEFEAFLQQQYGKMNTNMI